MTTTVLHMHGIKPPQALRITNRKNTEVSGDNNNDGGTTPLNRKQRTHKKGNKNMTAAAQMMETSVQTENGKAHVDVAQGQIPQVDESIKLTAHELEERFRHNLLAVRYNQLEHLKEVTSVKGVAKRTATVAGIVLLAIGVKAGVEAAITAFLSDPVG